MKFLIFSILALSGIASANEIHLAPGSSAVINATATTTVTCAGGSRGLLCRCVEYNGAYDLRVRESGGETILARGYGNISTCTGEISRFPICR